MKVFATLDPLFQYTVNAEGFKNKFVYGGWVASEIFYQALLKYGTFDEYHFFTSSEAESRAVKNKLRILNLNSSKIKIMDINDLPSCLRKIKYTVFFTADARLWRLAYLRAAYAKMYFPICTMTTTVSYGFMPKDIFLHNIIPNLEKFDSIICLSSAAQKAIKKLNRNITESLRKLTGAVIRYKARVDCLPLGVDANEFRKMSKAEARRAIGLNKNETVILYFGRFSLFDKADLYPVLLAFKEILAKDKNILLLLAGSDAQGKYGKKLKEITRKMGLYGNVKFVLPWVRDKACLYSASDIFISPSDNIQESFGITILEAMASGLPVIASDWNGYKDLILHNKTGFRIPTYWTDGNIGEGCFLHTILGSWRHEHFYLAQSVCLDVNKIKEYLSILINNKELRLRMGENARAMALEKFDWRILIPAFEGLLHRLSRLAEGRKITDDKKNYFLPEYFDCFRHYPTGILNRSSRIAIDKNGLEFLKIKALPFKIQRELLSIISIKIIFIILDFLHRREDASIGKIEGYCQKILKSELNIIRYNIMWMLKKGLLRVG